MSLILFQARYIKNAYDYNNEAFLDRCMNYLNESRSYATSGESFANVVISSKELFPCLCSQGISQPIHIVFPRDEEVLEELCNNLERNPP